MLALLFHPSFGVLFLVILSESVLSFSSGPEDHVWDLIRVDFLLLFFGLPFAIEPFAM